MMEPAIGDKILVRARPGLKVQAFANTYGRFLSDSDWQERLWDEWLHRRWLDGSIEVHVKHHIEQNNVLDEEG